MHSFVCSFNLLQNSQDDKGFGSSIPGVCDDKLAEVGCQLYWYFVMYNLHCSISVL